MWVSKVRLADIFGVEPRTITNWQNSKPPCPSRFKRKSREREYDTTAVIEWYVADALRTAIGTKKNTKDASLSTRQLEARTRLAEIELAEAEGRLLPLDEYEKELSRVCERIRAPVMVIPSKYMGAIQIARSDLEAQAVGERIRDELLVALQPAGEADDEEDVSVS